MKRIIRASVDPRKNTNRLLEIIDNHGISKDTVIEAFCNYLSDDDVGEVMHDLELDYEEE